MKHSLYISTSRTAAATAAPGGVRAGLPRFLAFVLWAVLTCTAVPSLAAPDVKRPTEVFRYDTRIVGNAVVVAWDIEDGYYLYRDKMKYSVAGPGNAGTPLYPPGEIHADEFFGEQIVFRGRADVRVPLSDVPAGTRTLELEIGSQGCADFGLCYPPQKWRTTVSLPAGFAAGSGSAQGPGAAAGAGAQSNAFPLGGDAGQGAGAASRGALGLGADENTPLPQEQVFEPTVTTPDPFTLEVYWRIEPGYYLYRKDFTVTNANNRVQFGALQLPPGVIEADLEFGDTEVYFDEVVVRVPFSRASPEAQTIDVVLGYQGCKKDSICYPPATLIRTVDLPRATASDAPPPPPVSEQDRLSGVIMSAGLPWVGLVFVGLGLLLAFTPCCLPMVPILSGIIAGQGDNVSTARAFWLSLSYVLGMAFTYTVAGAVFGAAGGQIQAALQTPAIIIGVSVLFVALSLAMFGMYELQLPASLQTRLAALGNRGKAGSFAGVAVMGAISALVVSTCVAPPLVAALTVIAQTGDVFRGAFALFWLSIGMGIPLLIFGTSAGKLLPKAGAWMNTVKGVFGIMLLGLAIWMLDRILPSLVTMLLWAALAVFAGVWFGAFRPLGEAAPTVHAVGKGAGVVALVYGLVLFVGALSGSTNPLQPLDRFTGDGARTEMVFERIKSVDEFNARLADAAANDQTVMLDFYADWCVSCKEMEHYTLSEPSVQSALANTVKLQADVTANDEIDQALLAHFGIFGPPTIVFFDRNGTEVEGQRVIGYMPTDDFLAHLAYVLQPELMSDTN